MYAYTKTLTVSQSGTATALNFVHSKLVHNARHPYLRRVRDHPQHDHYYIDSKNYDHPLDAYWSTRSVPATLSTVTTAPVDYQTQVRRFLFAFVGYH